MTNNEIFISGTVETKPEYSHTTYGEDFYRFELKNSRLSGVNDIVTVLISERILPTVNVGDCAEVEGEIRTRNVNVGEHRAMEVVVFALSMKTTDACVLENNVNLIGYICKPVSYRETPLGREIADVILAVNRYNGSDYVPLIIWGRNARYVSKLEVGSQLSINGRLQSREYLKKHLDGTSETKVAYEVSVKTLKAVEDENL